MVVSQEGAEGRGLWPVIIFYRGMERVQAMPSYDQEKSSCTATAGYTNQSNNKHMKTERSFSLRARGRSIRFAWEGINAFFDKQHNAVIHAYFTAFVLAAGIFLKVSTTETIILIVVSGFVWAAEIFNTVIEAMMDHLSPGQHPRIKFIKDVSAAAVLVSAITAALAGLFIFIPKIF